MEDTYRNFAVARDGSFIVYDAKIGESSPLWYRSLVGIDVHVIVGTDGAFGTPRISPDRKWIACTPQGATGVSVQPWPAMDRKYTVDATGREPLWHGANELVYFSYLDGKGLPGQTFNRVRMDGPVNSPVGTREVLFTDPRFVDTPGWSHSVMPGGGVVYLQATAENLGYYVRVIPNWVKAMKRAVDEANTEGAHSRCALGAPTSCILRAATLSCCRSRAAVHYEDCISTMRAREDPHRDPRANAIMASIEQ